jgi:hypothetical protein
LAKHTRVFSESIHLDVLSRGRGSNHRCSRFVLSELLEIL